MKNIIRISLLILIMVFPHSDLKAGEITDAIREHLLSTFKFDPEMTEIACRPGLDSITLNDTIAIIVSCREYPIPSGYFPLKVLLQDGSGAIRNISTSVDISFFEKVLVSKGRIKSREPLSRNDFTIKRVEVGNLIGDPISDFALLEGMRSSKTIQRGKALTEEMIEPIPVIRRGERVKLIYESGNLRVEAYGIARKDAVKGEMVEVKNTVSGKRISGRAMSEGIVLVER